MTAPEAITVEIQKLEPSAIVEMFEVDATAFGGDMLRFHAGTNQLRQNLVWQGETYSPFPIQASGFDYSGNGQLPRPKLAVANITGAITLLVLTYDDLLGAKVTRKRTLLKYLDAVNFPGGTNPTADPAAEFGDEIFFVDRKTSENRDVVEFELAAAFDVAGVRLPRRQIIQNVCTWKYRGGECGYTGNKSLSGTYTVGAAGGIGGQVRTVTITAAAHGLSVEEYFYFQPTTGAGVAQQMIVKQVTTNTITTTTGVQTATTSGACQIIQFFNKDDQPVASAGLDVCGKRLSSCQVRFGTYAPLPFGSFPAAGLTR